MLMPKVSFLATLFLMVSCNQEIPQRKKPKDKLTQTVAAYMEADLVEENFKFDSVELEEIDTLTEKEVAERHYDYYKRMVDMKGMKIAYIEAKINAANQDGEVEEERKYKEELKKETEKYQEHVDSMQSIAARMVTCDSIIRKYYLTNGVVYLIDIKENKPRGWAFTTLVDADFNVIEY